jgi:hypothetical protein
MLGLFVSPALGTGGWAILLGVGAGGGPAAAPAALLGLDDAAAAGADEVVGCDVVLKWDGCISRGCITAAGTVQVLHHGRRGRGGLLWK